VPFKNFYKNQLKCVYGIVAKYSPFYHVWVTTRGMGACLPIWILIKIVIHTCVDIFCVQIFFYNCRYKDEYYNTIIRPYHLSPIFFLCLHKLALLYAWFIFNNIENLYRYNIIPQFIFYTTGHLILYWYIVEKQFSTTLVVKDIFVLGWGHEQLNHKW